MKPLTIEELKALPVDEWIWLVNISDRGNRDRGSYRQIDTRNSDSIMFNDKVYSSRSFSNYGTKWVAYKNKEQAETKGEIVELPCIRETKSSGANHELVYLNKWGQIQTETLDTDELEDAERRLKELKQRVNEGE